MYPSRSERKIAKEKAKQARQLRIWTIINLGLIVVVAALLIYYFVLKEEETGTALSYYPGIPDSSEHIYVVEASAGDSLLSGKADELLKEKGYNYPYKYGVRNC